MSDHMDSLMEARRVPSLSDRLTWPVLITMGAAVAQIAIIAKTNADEVRTVLAVVQGLAAVGIIGVVLVWALKKKKRPATTTEQRLGGVFAVLFALGSLVATPMLWLLGMVLGSDMARDLASALAGVGVR